MSFLERPMALRASFASVALVGLLACGDDTSTTSGSGGDGGGTAATTSSTTASTTTSTTVGNGGAGGEGGTGGLGGAGGDGGGGGVPACDPITEEGCLATEVCEEVEGGQPTCFAPVHVTGRVFDYFTDDPIADARVVARDVNGQAVSPVAISAADGTYSLPVPAARDAEGNIVADPITLRADAFAYETFPLPPRVALPIDLSEATAGAEGDPWVVENAATDVGLIALLSTDGLGTIRGTVDMAELGEEAPSPSGTLILAGGATGIADGDGTFAVFNVPEGTYLVQGYLAGVNFTPEEAQVTAGAETVDVVVAANSDPTVTVSGAVQIVNGNGNSITSVILALEDTFDEGFIRFDAPPGLRAGDVSGEWSIDGVPDGAYVVLAAFENDGLVRDPDDSIAGTDIVHIVVEGADVAIQQGFKVTGALDVTSPGAEGVELTTATPTFVFADDSSEDYFDVIVRDAYGALVWQVQVVDPLGSGNADIEVPYAGPPLGPGVLYQFEATSWKDGSAISTTEDLKGVFQVEGEIGQGGGGGAGGDGGGGMGGATSTGGTGGAGGAGGATSTATGG